MMQFPPQITSTITIYPRWTDPVTGNVTNVRCVLKGCFWNEDSIGVFKNTGTQVQNSVTLFIPYRESVTGRKYVTPDEWNKAGKDDVETKLWTVPTLPYPIVINEALDYEFGWDTSAKITTKENQLTTSNRNARRSKDVNPQLFGSLEMRHILVRC